MITGLTDRQVAVLARMAQGMTNRAIARDLSLTVDGGVKRHRRAIFRTLNACNAPHAVAVAYEVGILRSAE